MEEIEMVGEKPGIYYRKSEVEKKTVPAILVTGLIRAAEEGTKDDLKTAVLKCAEYWNQVGYLELEEFAYAEAGVGPTLVPMETRDKEAADNRADIAEMKLAKAKALIQQMKCCYNCDHQGNNQKRCAECWNFDKWEIRK